MLEQAELDKKDLDELKSELSSLAELIVVQAIDNMDTYFNKGDVKGFKTNISKVKKFKDGLIIKKFLDRKKKENFDAKDKIEMLEVAKMVLSGETIV